MCAPMLAVMMLAPMAGMASSGGPVTWNFAAHPVDAGTVRVELSAVCEPGWHIYSLAQSGEEGPLPTVVTWDESPDYRVQGTVAEPVPVEAMDAAFGLVVQYHAGTTIFTQAVERGSAQPFTVSGRVEYMACNDRTCLPPHSVRFSVDIPAYSK